MLKGFTYILVIVSIVAIFGGISPLHAGTSLHCDDSSHFEAIVPLDTLTDFTLEAWVRLDEANQSGRPIYFGDDSDGFGLYLYKDLTPGFPSPLMLSGGNGHPSITGNVVHIPIATWVHIAVTKKGNLWTLFRNGMLAGRGTLTTTTSRHILRLGEFKGELQEIRIWKTARSGQEILSSLYSHLNETDTGLYLQVPIDSLTADTVIDKAHGFLFRRIGSSLGVRPVPSSLLLPGLHVPAIHWAAIPSCLQFLPRNSNGVGRVEFSGTILEPGYDSVLVERWKDNVLDRTQSLTLPHGTSSASFVFYDSIPAELSQYTFRLYSRKGSALIYLAEASDLVAGDVYVVDGQSNAHFAINWFYWQVPFVRSFGIQTLHSNYDSYDVGDTIWGYANCSGWGGAILSGPYLTGVWPMRLQQDIETSYGIPVCIINGATGGSTIEEHARNDSNREDLSTPYGRLLYRVKKAGCSSDIKAIFWDQGEFNTFDKYYTQFKRLYEDWQEDYPGDVKRKVYVLQVRPGCGPAGGSKLRELQRSLTDSLPNIEVMSTVGVRGHDGCHYDAFGYIDIGDAVFRLVARNYYRSSDTAEIQAPNVQRAFYSRPDSSEIRLVFRERDTSLRITIQDTLGTHRELLKDYFFLDGKVGAVREVLIRRDTVVLQLNGRSTSSHITYLPDQNYSDTDAVYEGPWIVNRRGIGVLTFDNLSISPFQSDTGRSIVDERLNAKLEIPFIHLRQSVEATQLELETSSFEVVTVKLFNLLGQNIASVVVQCQPGIRLLVPLDSFRQTRFLGIYAVAQSGDGSTRSWLPLH